VRYTPSIRRTLLLSRTGTYRSDRQVTGRVVELNAEASTFTLRSDDRDAVTCQYESELFSFIRDALQQDGAGPAVVVDGEAVLDERDRIRRLIVAEITYADQADELGIEGGSYGAMGPGGATDKLLRRLDELASLADGWLDGQGQAPNARVIAELRSMAGALAAEDMPALRIFPTPEGGIQLEWRSNTIERSVEVRADLSVYAVEVDTASGDTREWEHNRLDAETLFNLLRDGVNT
jgi:hypothetical protein